MIANVKDQGTLSEIQRTTAKTNGYADPYIGIWPINQKDESSLAEVGKDDDVDHKDRCSRPFGAQARMKLQRNVGFA